MRPSLRASLGALFVFLATAAPQGQVAPILDRLRDLVGVDVFAAARNAPNLATGEPFVAELATSQASEVALAGLVWIDASPSRYVAAMSAIEQFERGGAVRNTHRLADTPTADDFASLSLSPVDFAALRTCRSGRCELRLDDATITKLADEVDWSSSDAPAKANDIYQHFVLAVVGAYLEHGGRGLPTFHDKDRPISAADEFASLLEGAPELGGPASDMHRYFADYPSRALPEGATSFLYWQLVDFGLKPILRVSHLVVWPRGSVTMVTSRLVYASHYFWAALETRFLLTDPTRPDGSYFATVERSRSDGLTGFTGTLIGGTLRSHARQGLAAALGALRTRLAASP